MALRIAPAVIACVVVTTLAATLARTARADPEDFCAKARNDDQLRPYDPSRRPDFVRAFKKVFPRAKGSPSDAVLKAQAVFRCMDGKLFACFAGAILPCDRLMKRREVAGSHAACRATRVEDDQPASVALGSTFSSRCRAGDADLFGPSWTPDERGFARDVWVPLDLE